MHGRSSRYRNRENPQISEMVSCDVYARAFAYAYYHIYKCATPCFTPLRGEETLIQNCTRFGGTGVYRCELLTGGSLVQQFSPEKKKKEKGDRHLSDEFPVGFTGLVCSLKMPRCVCTGTGVRSDILDMFMAVVDYIFDCEPLFLTVQTCYFSP